MRQMSWSQTISTDDNRHHLAYQQGTDPIRVINAGDYTPLRKSASTDRQQALLLVTVHLEAIYSSSDPVVPYVVTPTNSLTTLPVTI